MNLCFLGIVSNAFSLAVASLIALLWIISMSFSNFYECLIENKDCHELSISNVSLKFHGVIDFRFSPVKLKA